MWCFHWAIALILTISPAVADGCGAVATKIAADPNLAAGKLSIDTDFPYLSPLRSLARFEAKARLRGNSQSDDEHRKFVSALAAKFRATHEFKKAVNDALIMGSVYELHSLDRIHAVYANDESHLRNQTWLFFTAPHAAPVQMLSTPPGFESLGEEDEAGLFRIGGQDLAISQKPSHYEMGQLDISYTIEVTLFARGIWGKSCQFIVHAERLFRPLTVNVEIHSPLTLSQFNDIAVDFARYVDHPSNSALPFAPNDKRPGAARLMALAKIAGLDDDREHGLNWEMPGFNFGERFNVFNYRLFGVLTAHELTTFTDNKQDYLAAFGHRTSNSLRYLDYFLVLYTLKDNALSLVGTAIVQESQGRLLTIEQLH